MGQYAVAGARNVGLKRDNNEDFHAEAVIERDGRRYSLWVVADGMGGGARGEVASQLAVETVLEVMDGADLADPRRDLDAAFKTANARVHAEGTGGGVATRSVMGTTLVAALVDEASNSAWIANVGDSRAYLVDGGPIVRITKDHSLVAERVEAGMITEEQARQEENRNVITRAIGIDPVVTVDVFGPSELAPGERLVLCSDGLHGMVDDATIAAIVGHAPFGAAVEQLIQAALEAGGNDNIAVVVGGPDEGDAGVTLVGSRAHSWAPARATPSRRRPPFAVLPLLVASGVVGVVAMAAAVLFWGPDDDEKAAADEEVPTLIATISATASPALSVTPSPTTAIEAWIPYLYPVKPADVAGCLALATHLHAHNPTAYVEALKKLNTAVGEGCLIGTSTTQEICLPAFPSFYVDGVVPKEVIGLERARSQPCVALAQDVMPPGSPNTPAPPPTGVPATPRPPATAPPAAASTTEAPSKDYELRVTSPANDLEVKPSDDIPVCATLSPEPPDEAEVVVLVGSDAEVPVDPNTGCVVVTAPSAEGPVTITIKGVRIEPAPAPVSIIVRVND